MQYKSKCDTTLAEVDAIFKSRWKCIFGLWLWPIFILFPAVYSYMDFWNPWPIWSICHPTNLFLATLLTHLTYLTLSTHLFDMTHMTCLTHLKNPIIMTHLNRLTYPTNLTNLTFLLIWPICPTFFQSDPSNQSAICTHLTQWPYSPIWMILPFRPIWPTWPFWSFQPNLQIAQPNPSPALPCPA